LWQKPKGLVFCRAFPGVWNGRFIIIGLCVFVREAATARGKERAEKDGGVSFVPSKIFSSHR
jgi:hypothetical protein